MDLYGRNFLTLLDYTPEEITYLLDLSSELKDKKKKGIPHKYLEGKNIVLPLTKVGNVFSSASAFGLSSTVCSSFE